MLIIYLPRQSSRESNRQMQLNDKRIAERGAWQERGEAKDKSQGLEGMFSKVPYQAVPTGTLLYLRRLV